MQRGFSPRWIHSACSARPFAPIPGSTVLRNRARASARELGARRAGTRLDGCDRLDSRKRRLSPSPFFLLATFFDLIRHLLQQARIPLSRSCLRTQSRAQKQMSARAIEKERRKNSPKTKEATSQEESSAENVELCRSHWWRRREREKKNSTSSKPPGGLAPQRPRGFSLSRPFLRKKTT